MQSQPVNIQKPLIEAWALGMFMLSATFFAACIELPESPIRMAVSDAGMRRFLMGLAMGSTAVALIYSPWGRRSGAHMNPAMTLAQWFLGKISGRDALFYGLAQTVGGAAAMIFCKAFFEKTAAAPSVNFVQTLPGPGGAAVAFFCEMGLSFGLVLLVLFTANSQKWASKTGWLAGLFVCLAITFEAPFSGMSMNPARSFASAVAAFHFENYWVYLFAPPIGMLGAAFFWKKMFWRNGHFECRYCPRSEALI